MDLQELAPQDLTLQDRLDAFKADFEAGKPPYNVPYSVIETMHRATAELEASGAVERAKKVGDEAPAFTLKDPEGREVSSADLLAQGPLIVSFYRGVWCPYCNLELQALQAALPAFEAAGAELVLIGEGLAALKVLIDRLSIDLRASIDALSAGLAGVVSGASPKASDGRLAPPRPLADAPAFPAWDLIDLERYRAVWQRAHGYFSLNMAASRGCSFRCNWCAKPTWGNHYLQRDAGESLADLARFALQPVAQDQWLHAVFACHRGGRFQRHLRCRNQTSLDTTQARVRGFHRLAATAGEGLAHPWSELDPIALQDAQRVSA